MNSYFRLCNIVYWIGLLLWCAALISAGVSAMNVFTVLTPDNLPLSVERYADFPREMHPRLVASHVMEPVFTTVDVMQFIAIPLVVLTLALQVTLFRMRLRRPANAFRAVTIVAAAVLFGYHVTSIAPVMNGLLRDWWSAAQAGDVAEAERVRAQFNSYHTTADNLLKINLFIVISAVGASAVAFSPPVKSTRTIETPALARR